MLKTVTLENEEIEILLSYHKERLAHAAKEIQTLSEKQQFSEARLRDLTEVHEKGDEASIEEHLADVVDIQDDGTLTVAAAHETEEPIEETPVAEASHETEEVHEHVEETPVNETSHEPEAVHEEEHVEASHEPEAEHEVGEHVEEAPEAETEHQHEEESPVAETSTEPEAVHEHEEETSVIEVAHKLEVVHQHEEKAPVAEISHEPEAAPHKGTFTIASEQ